MLASSFRLQASGFEQPCAMQYFKQPRASIPKYYALWGVGNTKTKCIYRYFALRGMVCWNGVIDDRYKARH